ncbi:serine/threonine-protein kinase LMTK1 isoform X1 [Periophthalmus magnuspinnatus]|uniref:serine/threonine-protein kinase LMTK1 isoform X1 n=1 Tax=Periophthalmus magnuspinnatus TaxID=409849 RepID=UPI00145AB6F5|nr:serine/threonine-protein kinase LMTK1 isoform X1 [Periophthalmus magnuspinnatus]
MLYAPHVIVMSSAFFNPSFAFSSHFDTDGAPLSELSWPSSLAVVAVSFSGLFTFVFLMLACLCCKKGDIGFKEFENTEGEDYQADLSRLTPPSSHNGPEVYILPLTEVSLPVSKQPGRSIQLLKSSDLGRHSLLYLKELGHGWFGKVLLGEVNAGLSTTQVVVKELKASASVQEQTQFLEEVQPYRLQHPALLMCLAQCTEVTPYLLVMEFCPLGDLKNYLHSCQGAESEAPDPLILQRMVCDISSGLLHLHKHNFIHSDLALRNCLLTSEMSVKIGDYGLSHSRYKEDYYITQDQIWVPLRWIAPELIDEVHGNLLVVDQTKSSNIWSLGVTMWELFELGNQPYRQFSDRQVLTYAVKEEQLKLPKPHLQFPLSERWYEVMQFCWLQPELRPSSEEVHLLVTYLCAKGSSEAEEGFEQRWNALRPNLLGSSTHTSSSALVLTPTPLEQTQVELASSASSFPLLEHFTDSFHSDSGDDLLTVTETSQGLNFEYKWEQARAEQPYCSSSTSGPLGQGNPHYQDIYYSCKESTCRGDSPTYYEPEHPGVVPVLSAHSPSVSSEYYIRIEEQVECNINLDDSIVDYSPGLEACSVSPETTSSKAQSSSYWSTVNNLKSTCYDSDSSPTVQLAMEPLLRENSSPNNQCSSQQVSSNVVYSERQSCHSDEDMSPESRTQSVRPIERLDAPMNISVAVSSPSLGFCDPYLEASNSYSMDTLQKTIPVVNHISIDVESDDGILMGRRSSREINNDDLFSEGESTNWTSNHSANNNSLSIDVHHTGTGRDNYLDLQYHVNTTDIWSLTKATTRTFVSSKSSGLLDVERRNPGGVDSYIHVHHEVMKQPVPQMGTNAYNLKSGKETNPKSSSTSDRLYSEPQIIPETSFIKSSSSGLVDKQKIWDGAGIHISLEDSKRELDSGAGVPASSLAGLGDYSDDEDDDLTYITSGIFADFNLDYANLEEEELSPVKTTNGTPGSVETLNLSSSMEQAFSPDNFNMPILPKSLDSGYDTENNESPKFLFKDDQSPRIGEDFVLQMGLDQEVSSNTSEIQLKALTDKNPYRDSAYFSDYENERSPYEDGSRFFPNTEKTQLAKDAVKFNDDLRQIKNNFEVEVSNRQLTTPGLSMLSPFPPEMGGCLTKESAPADEELGLETEQIVEELPSELSSSVSEPSSSGQDGSSNHEDGRKTGNSLPDHSLQSNCTLNEDTPTENTDGSTEDEEIPEINSISKEEERADVTINEEDFEDIDADSQDSLCEESSNGPANLSSSSSLLELCGEDVRAPLEEAEEEYNSDDSESDEELRTYNIQEEESEESEEDFSMVPVVVSDCSRARHLRSLLKMPSLLTQSFCEELEKKKKAVSFFDDVTVFLFDQESPTGELSDYTFATETESPEEEQLPVYQALQELESTAPTDSALEQTEEIHNDKSETNELEDDVPCEPNLPSPNGHPKTLSSLVSSPESPKPASVALNRFMVSRFSITHVTDSNASSVADSIDDSPND